MARPPEVVRPRSSCPPELILREAAKGLAVAKLLLVWSWPSGVVVGVPLGEMSDEALAMLTCKVGSSAELCRRSDVSVELCRRSDGPLPPYSALCRRNEVSAPSPSAPLAFSKLYLRRV